MNGKIILNLAMSLDGFIVDKNGGYDWIKGDGDKTLDTEKQFDMMELMNRYDVIVMGRTSYDEFGSEEMWSGKEIVVATSRLGETKENVTFVYDDIVGYVKKLRKKGKSVWLFGGSILTDYFIKANEVDHYEVAIVPIVLGDGKRLFFENNPKIELHLDSYTVGEGMPVLVYSRR